MSFVNIWIHAVWSTKHRKPCLNKKTRHKLIYHMLDNAEDNGIHINFINGCEDHLHLLISLNPLQCIADVIHQLKGESSSWMNRNKLTQEKFEWQSEYYAISISSSDVSRVRHYIKNQEKHHQNINYDKEIKMLL